jgi:hypothetical protein
MILTGTPSSPAIVLSSAIQSAPPELGDPERAAAFAHLCELAVTDGSPC